MEEIVSECRVRGEGWLGGAIIDYIWKIKMSDINSGCHSAQFELLQPQPSSPPLSGEVFLSLNDKPPLPSIEEDMTVGIVVDEETFIVLDRRDTLGDFSAEQWEELVARRQREVAGGDRQQKGEGMSRLSVRERGAVLTLKSSDLQARQRLWSIANYSEGVEQQFLAREKAEQQNKQQILTILSYELTQGELRSLKQNVVKLHKVVRAIGQHRGSSLDALRVWQHQKEIMQWVYDSLMRYALDDPQVRYCKGLEYVCLGVVVAFPRFDPPKYSQLLYHFLQRNAFRELYQEGSPRFFREVQRMRQALREDCPQLLARIEESQGDFRNLFVSYFRSCLVYRVTSPQPIRKVFELLFVEGIQGMRAVLLRVIALSAEGLLKGENLLEKLCSQVMVEYFEEGLNEEEVRKRFEKLFLV